MTSRALLNDAAAIRPLVIEFPREGVPRRRPGVRLDRLLRQMESEIRSLAKGNVAVQTGVSSELKDVEVSLDPTEAQDLIRHLVIDACDAMPRGGTLCITLDQVAIKSAAGLAHPDLSPGDYVILSVRDTDIGADSLTNAPSGGTLLDKGRALGLSACYEAIQHGNGCLAVCRRESETTIRIYFPCTTMPKPS